MKPNSRSRFAAAITLSRSKMYEYGVPKEHHLELPQDLNLEMQFPLAIGTLGDYSAEIIARSLKTLIGTQTEREEVLFAAQVLQAFDESYLNEEISFELRLLSGAGFYLGDIPGSATVQIRKLDNVDWPENESIAKAIKQVLEKPWESADSQSASSRIDAVVNAVGKHFNTGEGPDKALKAVAQLQEWAYKVGTAHELLMVDVFGAVCATRLANSAWTLLPSYSGIGLESWSPYLSRPASLKEMWPSQRMLGQAGLYSGLSGVVQMPTSAGKSRATELVIRSAFLSERTRLALVIAPFRALCQEIAIDLERAFKLDGINVNQMSDALQQDLDLNELFGIDLQSKPQVVVLTPEKLLYMLRQEPLIVEKAGLVVYDEGHQFDTGTRGVTYELLLTSITRLLPPTAQSVLISAVIQNAAAVAEWLLKDKERVVSNKSLQARRLIAFASLPPGKSGQLQFNVASENEQSFFVPRVIVPEALPLKGKETKQRVFPTTESGSIATYLALRLVENGGVAIYAARKVSAAKIVRDAVDETFSRGISLPPPSARSDPEELRRFVLLYEKNFGADSYLTKAASLGLFAHHGNTPQGIRLAIEHAMRDRLIHLIVCTSTLAQGVNLPIRYLLVTSSMQGRESIKARDFHNLMGRAGRAGMYGEGTVIFTDAKLYDERKSNSSRWEKSINLINPDSTEPTGSTLLSLLNPMQNDTGSRNLGTPTPSDIAEAIVEQYDELYESLGNLPKRMLDNNFSVKSLREQLEAKKKIVETVESFLMTYRSDDDEETFVANSRILASETLAYSLAPTEEKKLLAQIFEAVAKKIEKFVPNTTDQLRFGRTLLGVDHSLVIDAWVKGNMNELLAIDSSDSLLTLIWPLLLDLSEEERLQDTEPKTAIEHLAHGWLAGKTFGELLDGMTADKATYPYGEKRRKFDIDRVVELCEQSFGFEFALFLAAIRESFSASASEEISDTFKGHSDFLQKRLKYGLPSQDSICYFEAGFAERVVAQTIAEDMIWENATSAYHARTLVREHKDDVIKVLDDYPSYFTSVFENIVIAA